MRSAIVVISWWSNALGLETLHRLKDHAPDRVIYVVQVGKSPENLARFRRSLPADIIELDYPDDAPAEHSRVIANVAFQQLANESGLWFIDHDVFLKTPFEDWLATADAWFDESELCLCVHASSDSPAITQPAFWMSPVRWPTDIPDVDPIPFEARQEARRPDLFRHDGAMRMPGKDTLVLAYEKLSAVGRAGTFHLQDEAGTPLPPFPKHTHLGGLSLFAGPVDLPALEDWVRGTVACFGQFFRETPWLKTEDDELLRRLGEFRQWLIQRDPSADAPSAYEQVPYDRLKIHQDRRQFWAALKTDLEVKLGEQAGGRAFTLTDLGDWPDEWLYETMPMVVPGCEISVRDGYVWGLPPTAVSARRLFPVDSTAVRVFNGFNGFNPLAEVSAKLAAEMDWDSDRAFAFTRGVFLSLVTAGVCCPRY